MATQYSYEVAADRQLTLTWSELAVIFSGSHYSKIRPGLVLLGYPALPKMEDCSACTLMISSVTVFILLTAK